MEKFNNHKNLPFKWIDCGDEYKEDAGETKKAWDTTLVDNDNKPVLQSSEWLAIDSEDMNFIEEACNSYYQMKEEIENLKKQMTKLNNVIHERGN